MKKTFVLVLFLPFFVASFQTKKPDVWEPLRFLEGTWEGQGDGMSGVSMVRQEYQFILNGNFLRMKTRSEFKPQEKNPKGEIHEDVGFFSHDKARKKVVLRVFYVEGFINQYIGTISEDGKTLTFETEAIENAPPGTRAELVFQKTGVDALEQSFYVAWPGKDFSCFSTNRLKKK
jgi:hypothetical protein